MGVVTVLYVLTVLLCTYIGVLTVLDVFMFIYIIPIHMLLCSYTLIGM